MAEGGRAVRRARLRCKRDLLTTDEICVVFEGDESMQVSEEWPGFQDLLRMMETELGISPGWYVEIMVPAFEQMQRILFERVP